MAGPGKVFEEDFRKSAEKEKLDVDTNRLNDPIGGQAGVRNICDFIVYQQPFNYYLELKSRQGNTLSFKDITATQWAGLIAKAETRGVIPGVLVNFSDYNESYFVHIRDLVKLRDDEGKKSLHVTYAREHGVLLQGERIRVRFKYRVSDFLTRIGAKYGTR